MPRQPIQIEQRINVIRGSENGGFVLVPGCEPASTLTSTRMMAQMKEQGLCQGCAIVSVNDVLEAIPGSRIEFIANNGRMGGQKLLVLPAFDLSCPCDLWPDYYGILKSLCREATEEEMEEIQGVCDSFSIDPCQNNPQWRGQL